MRPIIFLFLIGLTVFSAVAARAQTTPPAKKAPATIAGRVTLDNHGAPGVHVMLKPHTDDGGVSVGFGSEQAPALGATTDADGRYRLADVPPGSYRVSAFAPAHAVEGESNPFTPGKTVNVAEGENVENVDFSLTRGAVITGRVIDEKDRPVIAEPVSAYKLDVDGKRQSIGFPNFVRWQTDDRGVYRIFGLEPGRYLVAAGVSSDDRLNNLGGIGGGYRQTFHPDAVEEAQAKIVEVKSGEEAANIDITIAPPVKGYAVTGRVVEADTNKPIPDVTVNYNTAGRRTNSPRAGSAVTNSLGEFRFEDLPPNNYSAFVVNTRGVIPTFGDQVTFDVTAGDVSGLEIRMQREATISGTVAIEGSNDPALRAKLAQVNLIAYGGSGPARVVIWPGGNRTISPNGTFKLSDVKPGKARITMGPIGPKGFALLRIEHNGVEVKEFNVNAGDQITGVRLVFAYGNSVIAGRVEVKGGALPPGARLEVTAWRQGEAMIGQRDISAEVDGRGQFVIEGLSQGTYKLVLTSENIFNLLRVEQMVAIAGEGRHEVTIVVDLTPKERNK